MRIVTMLFGAHLYGTDTQDSDRDYKGVALPSWKQVALGHIPKHLEYSSTGSNTSRNGADDIDIEIFSLHQFIKLACEGQTAAMDMLHAPPAMLIETSPIWQEIIRNRARFYSKNVQSFVGYAQQQAAKYGIKGSRLHDAQAVLSWLHAQPRPDARLWQCRDETFPVGEHIKVLPAAGDAPADVQVCGKTLQGTARIAYLTSIVADFVDRYGERARLAQNNQNVDWKALSHAVRAAFQVKELLAEGTITFPRPEAAFLRAIKTGQKPFTAVSEQLEALIAEVKDLRDSSLLPAKPDRGFWDNFLIDVVTTHLVETGHAPNRVAASC